MHQSRIRHSGNASGNAPYIPVMHLEINSNSRPIVTQLPTRGIVHVDTSADDGISAWSSKAHWTVTNLDGASTSYIPPMHGQNVSASHRSSPHLLSTATHSEISSLLSTRRSLTSSRSSRSTTHSKTTSSSPIYGYGHGQLSLISPSNMQQELSTQHDHNEASTSYLPRATSTRSFIHGYEYEASTPYQPQEANYNVPAFQAPPQSSGTTSEDRQRTWRLRNFFRRTS